MGRRRKKKRKTNSKKEERRQQYQKEQAKKKRSSTKKTKQAEKNPFSVFAEKDGEEVMDDDSVVFTEPSSSDHP